KSPRSGDLRVYQKGDILFLDFPSDTLERILDTAPIARCIGLEPSEVYKGKTDFLAVVKSEEAVQNLLPDFGAIARLPGRGLIVTAEGVMVDFVSRFFAPQSGVDEDPVTGSAHTSLIPLWSEKLGKDEMTARQLSRRGGELICFNKGARCLIGGKAILYMTGELNLFD
ncbi:MAG TPA: PhzF family phenazine biosynthesis protein, partial [Chryseosolibacter sp.]